MALTDPARELAITLETLAAPPNMEVSRRLAESIGREMWSLDVYRILFEIDRRCAFVSSEIDSLNLDDDVRQEAQTSLGAMRAVVGSRGVIDQMTDQVRRVLSGSNITVLKMLSSQVRERVAYESLSDEQMSEVIDDVKELITWLNELQSEEADFVRQALIDGLNEFLFRAENLKWFGTGQTIASLKEVMQAYLALEGVVAISDNNELAKAILLKTKACVGKILNSFKLAKEATETTGWALQAYGAVAAISDGSQTISGLLSG